MRESCKNYSLVSTAMCVAEAALRRNESRGAHYREDYPEMNNCDWLQHLVLTQAEDNLTLATTPADLREMQPAEKEAS